MDKNEEEKIKEIRAKIECVLDYIRELGQSREKSLCITRIQEAKMWLGKILYGD